ncbi:O-antigen ligase family protein [Geodermatophilus sp. SYSU D00525]
MAGDRPGGGTGTLTARGASAAVPAASRTTASGPEAGGRADSLAVLVLYAVLLVGIPSVYIVGPLGAPGTPAAIVGVVALGLWVLRRLTGAAAERPTPVHWLLLLFAASIAGSVVAAGLRPMVELEFTALWRGLIAVASWIGIALTVMDGLRTRERLERFLRVLVWLGAGLGLLGGLQFLTGIDVVPVLHVPGLTQNTDLGGLYERSGFNRVSGTALHSIEYAAVMSMLLPLAFAQALRRGRSVTAWLPVLLIAGALPLTVARSGMLGLGVALAFAFLMTRGPQRVWLLVAVAALGVVVRALVPGLLGTISSLFTAGEQDISIAGRTADYGAVADFVSESPVSGRGLFTFLPSIYRILDNQYLGTLIEAGVVGLVALVLLIAGPAVLSLTHAVALRRAAEAGGSHRPPAADHLLPLSLGAALVAALLLFATFDGFSFPMCMGVFSVVVGAVGATWRLGRPAPAPRPARGRWQTLVALGVAAVVGAVGLLAVRAAQPAWSAEASLAIAVPPEPGQNIYYARVDTDGVTDLLRFGLDSTQVRTRLAAAGAGEYTVAIGTGSLGPHTDVLGFGDVMRVGMVAATPEEATHTVDLLVQEVDDELRRLQPGRDPASAGTVTVVDVQRPVVTLVPVHPAAGAAGVALLALLAGLVVAAVPVGSRPRPAPAPAAGRHRTPEPVGAGA